MHEDSNFVKCGGNSEFLPLTWVSACIGTFSSIVFSIAIWDTGGIERNKARAPGVDGAGSSLEEDLQGMLK